MNADLWERVLPLLAFLATVVVFAELVAEAEVFDVVAARLARAARGRVLRLFGLCVLLATATTVALNLDTTAVLLTPVLLALAARISLPPLPFAMTTVWLANTASLLLPVSNLTNLLAIGRLDLSPLAFAARMAAPAFAAVAVTAVLLWVLFWRPVHARTPRYDVPEPHAPSDPVLTGIAGATVLGFLVAVLADAPLWAASAVSALVVAVAFAVRRRSALGPFGGLGLVPWPVLALVAAMFAVVGFATDHGLSGVVEALVGDDGSPWRAAATGLGSANLINNLPAYLAGESALGPGSTSALLALLIGVNVGPLITPWASLATLIWFGRCRSAGVSVPRGRFLLAGALLAVTATAAATGALVLTT
ncbi:SLC13 family permease [Spongisporangium articulatum]|uniref:SLC13 family permease n=1 Tax=Spongisporangium articulatum TaxID=3362603 RepID=A0ABW8ALS1_9ACTN